MMTHSIYGKYIISDPSVYSLAYGISVPKEMVTGRTSVHTYLDNDLVEGCEKHVGLMWFTDVPYPNPFIEPHAHPYDEILLFIGSNSDDLTDLGAEIELYLGEEEERHVITKTTAVFLPMGLKHVIKHVKVHRPHVLVPVSMSGVYS